jgi:hypothetical protein
VFRLADVRALVESRLSLIPRFRRRVMHVPFGLGRPIWVDDPEFDIARHVKLTAHLGGASEPANWTWTFSATTKAVGGISGYTGVDPANPIETAATAATTTTSTSHIAPSVVTDSWRALPKESRKELAGFGTPRPTCGRISSRISSKINEGIARTGAGIANWFFTEGSKWQFSLGRSPLQIIYTSGKYLICGLGETWACFLPSL